MFLDSPLGPDRLDHTKRAELWDEFDTVRLLRAVDALDHLLAALNCSTMADRTSAYGPSELREKLLQLHRITLDQHERVEYADVDPEVFELAWELEDRLYDIEEVADSIGKVLRDLTELAPDPDEEAEDDEEDGF